MKKGIKIFLIILIIIVVAVGLVVGFKVGKDIKEKNLTLTCTKTLKYIDYTIEEKIVFKFSDDGLKKQIQTFNFIYPTVDGAKEYYDEFSQYNSNMKLENSTVTSTDEVEFNSGDVWYEKTKEEVKKYYIDELHYDACN